MCALRKASDSEWGTSTKRYLPGDGSVINLLELCDLNRPGALGRFGLLRMLEWASERKVCIKVYVKSLHNVLAKGCVKVYVSFGKSLGKKFELKLWTLETKLLSPPKSKVKKYSEFDLVLDPKKLFSKKIDK